MIKVLGISDDITTCDKCGKKHLKRTVALDFDGEIAHYGVDCAARALTPKAKSAVAAMNSVADAISRVEMWIANGYTLDVVANAVWNKFGYTAEFRNGILTVKFSDEITMKWAVI